MHPIVKDKVTLFLSADNMIVSVENPIGSTKKATRTNEFNKTAGYKINTQKPVLFLHNTNNQLEIAVKKNLH